MRREPIPEREAAELARLQRGLQRLIGAPGARAEVDSDAAGALGCAAEEVAVYRDMIALRFAREVRREFPATRAWLGDARFEPCARAYAETHASSSYTLDGYARAFPSLLARAADPALRAAAALARLEREIAAVPARAARASMRIFRRAATLVPAPGTRLCVLGWDAEAALARFERSEPAAPIERATTHVALFLRDARVVRLRIARAEAPLLRAILRGDPLETAVARGLAAGLSPAAVGTALERWVAGRLLSATPRAATAPRPARRRAARGPRRSRAAR